MTTPYIRSFTETPLIRLSAPAPEPNRGRRPHDPEAIARLRQLYTSTTLPLRELARRTGIGASTISRRALWGGWMRPDAALRAEPVTPAGRRALRRQAIAEALLGQAERLAFEREMDPASTERRLLKAARLVRLSRRLDEEERTLTKRRKVGRKKPPKPVFETPLSAYGAPPPPAYKG
jgi:transposase-like protein